MNLSPSAMEGMNLSSPIIQSILAGNNGRLEGSGMSDDYIKNYYDARTEHIEEYTPMYNNQQMMYGYQPQMYCQPQYQPTYGYPQQMMYQNQYQQPQMLYQQGYPQPVTGYQQPMTAYINGQPTVLSGGDQFSTFMNPPGSNQSYYANYVPGMNYNSYLFKAQQDAARAAREEFARKQSDTMKTISRCAHAVKGDKDKFEDFDKFLDETYNYVPEKTLEEQLKENPDYEEYMKYAHLEDLYYKAMYNIQNPWNVPAVREFNRKIDEVREEFPDDMGLAEYLSKCHKLYFKGLKYQYAKKINDGSRLYDSKKFRELIRQSNGGLGNYFNSILKGKRPDPTSINVGDLTIDLPLGPNDKPRFNVTCPFEDDEYNEAFNKFFDAIDQDHSTVNYYLNGGPE